MRILLTGSTGLLGTHILYRLLRSPHKVRCLIRKEPPAGLPASASGSLEWQRGDLLDVYSLQDALQGVDAVIHAAGMVSFDPRKREDLYQVNVEGTANLVNMSLTAGVSRMVHVSSVAALGRSRDGQQQDETAEWLDGRHNSQYALSKHLGEQEVFRGMAEGLSAVIVNPTIILGPAADYTRGSVAIVRKIHQGFSWYTRGVNGWVDARDVAQAVLLLLESSLSGERFIVNADNQAYRFLFESIARELGVRPPARLATALQGSLLWRMEALKAFFGGGDPLVTRETARTAQMRVSYSSAKLLQAFPGFSFRKLEDTIRDSCAYFRQSRLHPSAVTELWEFLNTCTLP